MRDVFAPEGFVIIMSGIRGGGSWEGKRGGGSGGKVASGSDGGEEV